MNTLTIKKWGNSLALRLPKHSASWLKEGVAVSLTKQGQSLSVTPVLTETPTLKELLATVAQEGLSREDVWGAPQGREIW